MKKKTKKAKDSKKPKKADKAANALKDKKSKKGEKRDKAKKSTVKKSIPKDSPAHYSDGHPLDEIQFLESKIILKGERFTSLDSFNEFAKLVKRAAEESGVGFSRKGFKGLQPELREVLFLDTADFKLYNNAFILRRRTPYEHGFLAGDPEMVFKFRHTDQAKTAELDVRPKLAGPYLIKFKAEALPLKDELGGIRMLYSHNAQFPMSSLHESDRNSMATLVRVFPALAALNSSEGENVEFVNQTAVVEVLLDIGMLDFGKGITSKANVAVWRTRGDEKQLVGEFAYQCKFRRESDVDAAAMKRNEQFFVALQHIASDWVAPGINKTGAVYRLKGNPPSANE